MVEWRSFPPACASMSQALAAPRVHRAIPSDRDHPNGAESAYPGKHLRPIHRLAANLWTASL